MMVTNKHLLVITFVALAIIGGAVFFFTFNGAVEKDKLTAQTPKNEPQKCVQEKSTDSNTKTQESVKDPRDLIYSTLTPCNPDESTFRNYEQHANLASFLWKKFFKNQCGGTFVDIGANDGITFSNSKFWEAHVGWTGVCIEPLPTTFRKLAQTRPRCINYNVGLADRNKVMNFIELLGNGKEPTLDMGSCFEEFCSESHKASMEYYIKNGYGKKNIVPVQVMRLADVLKEQKITVVDFMSLDCEGCEPLVLKGIDFDKVVIRYILSEHRGLTPFLESKGYKFLGNDQGWGPDYLYELQRFPKNYIPPRT